MPLIHSSSDKARSENIKELMHSNTNRPIKQVIAIAYHNQREVERHAHEKFKYGQ